MAALAATNSPSKLADRLKALEENQQKWKSRVQSDKRRPELSSSHSLLSNRKSALLQSADDWRKRVRTEPTHESQDAGNSSNSGATAMLAHSGRVLRPRRHCPNDAADNPDNNRNAQREEEAEQASRRQTTRDSDDSVSPKRRASVEAMKRDEAVADSNAADLKTTAAPATDAALLTTPKRAAPRALNRRPPTRARHVDKMAHESMDLCRSEPPTAQKSSKFELGRELDVDNSPAVSKKTASGVGDHNKENRHSLFVMSPLAFQTPIIGKEHCGVKLRTVERKSPFPEIMLIQAKGTKLVDVRLVAPQRSSVRGSASYLLVTPKRLVVYNGEHSSVSERSKIAQMAHEILSGKEMSCLAAKVEMANDDHAALSAFWRSLDDDTESRPLEIDTGNDEPEYFEEEAARHLNRFHVVTGENSVEALENGEIPEFALLDTSKILVLDFGSEIYTWIGRNAERSLLKTATDFAQKLKSTPLEREVAQFLNDHQDGDHRPDWTLCRRLTQGIADCTFRHKFCDWKESSKAINLCTPSLSPVKRTPLRPMSAPVHAMISPSRISTPGVEEFLKDEDELAKLLAEKFAEECTPQEHVLVLEGMELRHSDRNVYTEQMKYYRLVGELLEDMDSLEEFHDSECYVVEWRYRIEREGVRKLDGSQSLHDTHDTGRQRVAFFYWLGGRTTVKEQSLCALALRNRDKERHEHIRVEQGAEPPVFLHLFEGRMIVSGAKTGVYLVTGSEATLFSAQELYEPVELRPQAAYLKKSGSSVEVYSGARCSDEVLAGAEKLAEQLAKVKQAGVDRGPRGLECLGYPCIEPTEWAAAPRAFRIYELEGDELQCVRYNPKANFTFRQADMRDCVFIDQQSHLWIWADHVVSTYALKVASEYWSAHRKMDASATASVICRGREPDAFRALFPTWQSFDDKDYAKAASSPPATAEEFEPDDPRVLSVLLHERTRPRTIEEVRERNLPKGCSLSHLEQYLSDADFESLFRMPKADYKSLPRWKQIALKKDAKIF